MMPRYWMADARGANLLSIAYHYAADLGVPSPEKAAVDELAPKLGRMNDAFEYSELRRANPLKSFGDFSMAICAELPHHRSAKQVRNNGFAKLQNNLTKVLGRRCIGSLY
jgi:hypothetical protein